MISYDTLIFSQTASRHGLDNTPPDTLLPNLQRLIAFLKDIESRIAHPIIISSGYRSPSVNSLVGGSRSSAHMSCRAADITSPSLGTPFQLCSVIAASDLQFDQMIYEFRSWCHIAIPQEPKPGTVTPPLARREILTILSSKTGYQKGLIQG